MNIKKSTIGIGSGKRKRQSGFFESKVFLVAFVGIAVLLGNASFNMYSKSKDAKNYYKAVETEYLNLDERYADVSYDLEYIKSDTGMEREIRSKFDLAREGEKAILITEEELPEIQTPTKRGIWERIVNWVSS